MQHQQPAPFPPPDIAFPPTSIQLHRAPSLPQHHHPQASAQSQSFLIISLFALRLTHQLIHSLAPYPEQISDTKWLNTFLAPYTADHALAKISGHRRDDYTARYRDVVARMKRQPRYPMCFMRMNPDYGLRCDDGVRGDGVSLCLFFFSSYIFSPFFFPSLVPITRLSKPSQISEINSKLTTHVPILPAHRLEIINFSDAASEWGSVVPIPACEAARMMELAGQRRIAEF